MIVRTEIGTGQLAELVKQVQAGNEVLLTQSDKAVPKLVPAHENGIAKGMPLHIRPLKGHRVLIPNISQEDLAEDMFGKK